MIKKSKILQVIFTVLTVLLIVSIIFSYPYFVNTFERSSDESSYYNKTDMITTPSDVDSINDGNDFGQFIPDRNKIPNNFGRISYKTTGIQGGEFEYTLNDVKIYDNFASSGLSIKDCISVFQDNIDFQKQPFILFDMTIENISEYPGPYDDPFFPFVLDMWVMYTTDKIDGLNYGAYKCYFSEHPTQTRESTNYFHFALDIGEHMDFEYGICAPIELVEKKGFLLCLGSYENEKYFNPFDEQFSREVVK